MTEITNITLENEMDIVVVHKRMLAIGEQLKFTLTTQTAFSTAIAEVSREIIDKTNTGVLSVFLINQSGKYLLSAKISYTGVTDIKASDPGMAYARRLVSSFDIIKEENGGCIELQISIPRSAGLDPFNVRKIGDFFKEIPASSPYEELKDKYASLNTSHAQKEEQLRMTLQMDNLKTEFLSVASHELKTPLTTLKAYAQMAQMLGKDQCSETLYDFITKINKQCSKLQQLMAELMDIAKLESGKIDYNKEATALTIFIEEVVDSLKILYPDRNIIYHPPASEVHVNIDKLRMEQVLANLIGNAAKYSGYGSNITIDVLPEDAGKVCISIKDDGIGMDPEYAVNIFKKFYRSDSIAGKYPGLGMGLYISKNIVEDHGGTIWVKSAPGKGSAFFFTVFRN